MASASFSFSLLSETGRTLLARDARLSLTVLESGYSPNRGDPVAIVGIVVVQSPVIPSVANSDIVGVTSVGRAVNPSGIKRIAFSLIFKFFVQILLVSASV